MKRIFDVASVFLLMVIFSPLLIFIVLLQCTTLHSFSIFFAQDRIGRKGKLFKCIKFRTMVLNADDKLREHLDRHPIARAEWNETHKLRNDPRVTGFGRYLRALSLDELPQLWNILRGDMSLVGPRPVTQLELESWYSPLDGTEDYLSVRPGLTGLWQISGRSNTSYSERVALDRRYVKHVSFRNDFRILYRTFWTVVRREGAW